jgi:MSHA pilin protein MshD
MSSTTPSARRAGFSLIEVAVFVVVLGVGFAGMLVLYNRLTSASVDPMVRKQALAIAASLLEEIELRGFTYCDPDDANVYTASSAVVGAGACAATVEGIGPEGGETRTTFDNVSDYHGFSMGSGQPAPNITTLDGSAVGNLSTYSVDVAVAVIAQDELPGFKTVPGAGESPVADALRITVTARHPGSGVTVSLQGYRTRYAPNSP